MVRVCKIDGCGRPHLARGYCTRHYLKWHRFGDPLADNRHKQGRFTHGDSRSPEYKSWSELRQRCNNPESKLYPYYGGRGISVCKRWDDYKHFLADMGRRPTPKHSIDRIDNNGNYEPGNCRWATKKQQARNRRSNRVVTVRGKKMLLCEAEELLGINYTTILARLNRGDPIELRTGG